MIARAFVPLLAWLLLAGVGFAADGARAILDHRKALDDGPQHWADRHQVMHVSITGTPGGDMARELEIFEKRYPGGDPDLSQIIFFLAPAEIEGTSFLGHRHPGHAAEQLLYTRAAARTRQISGNFKRQRFVGSDLTFYDLELVSVMIGWTEADARSTLAGEETIDGTACSRIELEPQAEDAPYRHITLWLGKDDLFPRRLDLAGDGGKLVKRIVQEDVRTVGRTPTAFRIVVETPAEGTRTVLTLKDAETDKGLDDALFTTRSLERGHP